MNWDGLGSMGNLRGVPLDEFANGIQALFLTVVRGGMERSARRSAECVVCLGEPILSAIVPRDPTGAIRVVAPYASVSQGKSAADHRPLHLN
jgi:hypothetical protein